mmetsp:Transcript_19816/g.76054  ORF Transcript_19816/g.76054 Transcript_19816/m.76054 type:complete len:221 (-) Transcript_19816:2565-3227(-)
MCWAQRSRHAAMTACSARTSCCATPVAHCPTAAAVTWSSLEGSMALTSSGCRAAGTMARTSGSEAKAANGRPRPPGTEPVGGASPAPCKRAAAAASGWRNLAASSAGAGLCLIRLSLRRPTKALKAKSLSRMTRVRREARLRSRGRPTILPRAASRSLSPCGQGIIEPAAAASASAAHSSTASASERASTWRAEEATASCWWAACAAARSADTSTRTGGA